LFLKLGSQFHLARRHNFTWSILNSNRGTVFVACLDTGEATGDSGFCGAPTLVKDDDTIEAGDWTETGLDTDDEGDSLDDVVLPIVLSKLIRLAEADSSRHPFSRHALLVGLFDCHAELLLELLCCALSRQVSLAPLSGCELSRHETALFVRATPFIRLILDSIFLAGDSAPRIEAVRLRVDEQVSWDDTPGVSGLATLL
jgi:hypothetical protein